MLADIASSDMPFVHDLDVAALRQAQQRAAQTAGVAICFSDTLYADGSKGPEMMVMPSGWFEIGSPTGEVGHQPAEEPQFRVQVERAFAIGKYTVTAEEWERFARATGFRPLRELIWPKDREPIVNVRLADIERYIDWLNRETHQHYRLPTEAEWEYAARAGSAGPFHFGDSVGCKDVAFRPMFPLPEKEAKRGGWLSFLPQCAPMNWAAPVGQKDPNVWGLYDVHGNVWELTVTPWHPSHAKTPRSAHEIPRQGKNKRLVTKGGSWFDPAVSARSAARWPRLRDELDVNLGFRLVREL